jgi:hypothetical protein
MTAMQEEFYRLVDVFIDSYSSAKALAILKLGDMFDPMDYPSADELRSKFRFEIDKEPIPETGDWRVDVQNDAMADLKSEYETKSADKINRAMNDVWSQLHGALSHLSDKIDYGDHEDKKNFNTSTVEKLTGLVDLLDAFNITGDPKMLQMGTDLKRSLRGVSREALRESEGLRAETKKALDAAIRDLPSLM